MKFRLMTCSLLLSLAGVSHATDPIMTKDQFEDFTVKYRCIEIQHERDIGATETALAELQAQYGLNETNYDAFGELSETYQKDNSLQNRIRERVMTQCNQQ